ncbi:MAG TPA: GatB/YqeY domain-containing protein [Anaerolineales bacterium]|nr:GatB/YqeY domain-containing protein [Anaerolineales bacterium]
MALKANLEQALKDAMRSNNTVSKNTIRMALSALKEAEVLKKADLDDSAILALLQKEVKSRNEALAEAEKASRPDLAENAKAEIKVLEGFLPQGLSAQEIEEIVEAAIAEVGATTPADMGKVMKAVLPRLQGRADGGQVSQLVRSKLQG